MVVYFKIKGRLNFDGKTTIPFDLPTSNTPSEIMRRNTDSSAEALQNEDQSGVYVKQSAGGYGQNDMTSTFSKRARPLFPNLPPHLRYRVKKVGWISGTPDYWTI
jgi:hypothetical protein